MKYVHRFQVHADLAEVRAFHQRAGSMAAITPPPVAVDMHETPETLNEGDEMEFTLRLGPIPIRWRARIENVTATSFDDRQLAGPFQYWRHRHSFVPLPNGDTEVLDEVTAELSRDWIQKVLGFGMWISLPLLFTFRAWKTRRLLNRAQSVQFDGSTTRSE